MKSYSKRKVAELLKRTGGMAYELGINGYGKEEPWDPEEMDIEALADYLQDYELEVYLEFCWFDDGGPAGKLIFANEKAREGVYRMGVAHWDLAFIADYAKHPEDYKVFQVSAV